MAVKRRKKWITPLLKSFGSSDASAQGQSGHPRVGPNCGETIIRYGPQCAIRIGPACKPRIGPQCHPTRYGPSCTPRVGAACLPRVGVTCGAARTGSECLTLPDEPLPPVK